MADDLPDVYLRFVEEDSTEDDPQPTITGESQDSLYPGKDDGWLTIKSFSFGFKWSGESGGREEVLRRLASGEKLSPAGRNDLVRRLRDHPEGQNGTSGHAGAAPADGTLQPEEFNFSRSPGPASLELLAKLRTDEEIPKAELIVCRASGVDIPGWTKDSKIPFLRFVFEKVQLSQCTLELGKDQPPSESVKFKFKKVTMETIWTENTTGARVPGGNRSISFDFDAKEGETSWDQVV